MFRGFEASSPFLYCPVSLQKSQHYFRKKDNFKDKKADCRQRAKAIASPFNADNQARIKRIIFLKNREVPYIQTKPNLCLYPLFQIYPSSYKYLIRLTKTRAAVETLVYPPAKIYTKFCIIKLN